MRFCVKTEYDLETLKEFNQRHSPHRKASLAVVTVCGTLLFIMSALLIWVNAKLGEGVDIVLAVICALSLFITVFSVVWYTVIFARILKKQAEAETVAEICFDEDAFTEHTKHKHGEGSNTLDYSCILKVTESVNAYYLYISRNAAVIVSKFGFTMGRPQDFLPFLRTKTDSGKIKIK